MTPYRYFRDKEEILAVVRAEAFDRFSDALEAAFDHTEGDAAVRSHAVAQAYVQFAQDEPHAYRLMFDISQPGQDAHPDLVRATARARSTMVENLRGLMPASATGQQAVMISHAYWAAVHGVVMLQMSETLEPAVEAKALLNMLAERITGSIGAMASPA